MTNVKEKTAEAKTWSVRPVWQGRQELASKLRVSEFIAQLLYNRDISDFEQARHFLQPSLNDLIDPQQLTGIPAAVKRIRNAVSQSEKIVLYGDYDVDGIVSVAILWRCLKLAGVEAEFYVPHRIDEGYGLNVEAIRQLAQRDTKLIITVDCGITAHESAAEATRLGVDLIITDHHKIDDQPVQAVAIVHPFITGQDYPNKNLCGAGVAFKLAWALAQEFSGAKKVSDEFRRFLLWATAMAALGTIADVVPLSGENRVLARFGMEGLTASTDPAVRALIKAAGLDGTKLNSTDIGFRLAPRLNAAGRMGHARLAVEMLTKSSPQRAEEIAHYLEGQNRQRQKVEKKITAEAIQQVKQLKMDKDTCKGIVLAGEDWHGGVIGIVASRIVDKYRRPTIVISLTDEKAVGSCRSVSGFDVCLALEACSEYLSSYGGHAMAAGLTLKPDKLEPLRQAFNEHAIEHLCDEDLIDKIDIDAEVSLDELDLETVKTIERLGPFGAGNPNVRLVIRDLRLVGRPRRIGGGGAHLQFTVSTSEDSDASLRPGGVIRVIAFGKAHWEKKLIDAETFALAFEPMLNHYNGNTTVEFMAKDLSIDKN